MKLYKQKYEESSEIMEQLLESGIGNIDSLKCSAKNLLLTSSRTNTSWKDTHEVNKLKEENQVLEEQNQQLLDLVDQLQGYKQMIEHQFNDAVIMDDDHQ